MREYGKDDLLKRADDISKDIEYTRFIMQSRLDFLEQRKDNIIKIANKLDYYRQTAIGFKSKNNKWQRRKV